MPNEHDRDHAMKLPLALLATAALISCARQPAHPWEASPRAYREWQETGSYYALLEIVDAHIDPFNKKNVTRQQVLHHLGTRYNPDYPGAGPKMLVYPSSRKVPYGSYLIISFDDSDCVKSIDWVSE